VSLDMVAKLSTVNICEGNRNLPSNTPTAYENDRPGRGFSGSTRATQPVSRKVVGILPTESRFPAGRIPIRTYSNSSVTGYTRETETGS
jgi:hypothetical protein